MKKSIIIASLIALLSAACHLFAENPNQLLREKKYGQALELFKTDPNTANFVGKNGITPLHIACARGKLDIATELIKQGANIHHVDNGERTVLVKAVWGKNNDLAKLLIEKGVDINKSDKWTLSPLHHAINRNAVRIAKTLIATGAHINTVDEWKRTPLISTIQRTKINLAKLLIQNGANVNQTNEENESPLILSSQRGRSGLVELLLKNGANPNTCDTRYGRNALHYAAIGGYETMMKQLWAEMEEPEKKDSSGRTCKDYVAKYTRPVAGSIETEVAKATGNNNAQVFYTGHSGWVVKTAKNLLVFDYWKPNLAPSNPSLFNGYVTAEETGRLPVTVFISHDHGDHYDIKSLKKIKTASENVHFVYGFKPKAWKKKGEIGEKTKEANSESKIKEKAVVLMKPNTEKTLSDMNITTIKSIDTGVGFLVEVDGLSIFHAGDHANLSDADKETYFKEIKFLEAKGTRVDIAFLPVSGCPSRWKAEAVEEGFMATAERLHAKMVFPMHASRREHEYLKFAKIAKKKGSQFVVNCAENPGDHFTYSKSTPLIASK